TINSGSSSIKTSLYRMSDAEQLLFVGQLDGITREQGKFRMRDAAGRTLIDQEPNLPDHGVAFQILFDWLKQQSNVGHLQAVGHRVVHGGARFRSPQRVTPELLAEVRRLVPFDPLHLPSEIEAIEAVARFNPAIPQVACFDTAFHGTIP